MTAHSARAIRLDRKKGDFSPDSSLPKWTRCLISRSKTFPDADSTVQTQGVLNGLDYGKYS